jgi:hypothetical protein
MKLTNEKLYELCKKYGAEARLWRQKFIGLLPEVNRRRLYKEKGFSSVFEFAAKLCGLSAEQVRLALNLEKRFEDKPILKRMLENGEISINKLTRIVSIATPDNEEELAEKIKVLPTRALETFVRDASRKDLHVQILNFEIDDDIKEELNELNSKSIDVNKLLREMLQQRREEINKTKEHIAENIQPTNSRYIPAKIKKILQKEYGEKCSIATCQRKSTGTHHMQRFSLSQNHNPKFLAPLCHDHHVIAHSIDLQYHVERNLSIRRL